MACGGGGVGRRGPALLLLLLLVSVGLVIVGVGVGAGLVRAEAAVPAPWKGVVVQVPDAVTAQTSAIFQFNCSAPPLQYCVRTNATVAVEAGSGEDGLVEEGGQMGTTGGWGEREVREWCNETETGIITLRDLADGEHRIQVVEAAGREGECFPAEAVLEGVGMFAYEWTVDTLPPRARVDLSLLQSDGLLRLLPGEDAVVRFVCETANDCRDYRYQVQESPVFEGTGRACFSHATYSTYFDAVSGDVTLAIDLVQSGVCSIPPDACLFVAGTDFSSPVIDFGDVIIDTMATAEGALPGLGSVSDRAWFLASPPKYEAEEDQDEEMDNDDPVAAASGGTPELTAAPTADDMTVQPADDGSGSDSDSADDLNGGRSGANGTVPMPSRIVASTTVDLESSAAALFAKSTPSSTLFMAGIATKCSGDVIDRADVISFADMHVPTVRVPGALLSLPWPGKYTLELWAGDAAGHWMENASVHELHVPFAPRVYLTNAPPEQSVETAATFHAACDVWHSHVADAARAFDDNNGDDDGSGGNHNQRRRQLKEIEAHADDSSTLGLRAAWSPELTAELQTQGRRGLFEKFMAESSAAHKRGLAETTENSTLSGVEYGSNLCTFQAWLDDVEVEVTVESDDPPPSAAAAAADDDDDGGIGDHDDAGTSHGPQHVVHVDDLTDGEHTLSVLACVNDTETSAADGTMRLRSNCSQVHTEWTWTVDTTVPTTSIVDAPPAVTQSSTAEFVFSASKAATFRCQLDHQPQWEDCGATHILHNLADGPHALRVSAVDAAGRADLTPEMHEWSVQTLHTRLMNCPADIVLADASSAWSSTLTAETAQPLMVVASDDVLLGTAGLGPESCAARVGTSHNQDASAPCTTEVQWAALPCGGTATGHAFYRVGGTDDVGDDMDDSGSTDDEDARDWRSAPVAWGADAAVDDNNVVTLPGHVFAASLQPMADEVFYRGEDCGVVAWDSYAPAGDLSNVFEKAQTGNAFPLRYAHIEVQLFSRSFSGAQQLDSPSSCRLTFVNATRAELIRAGRAPSAPFFPDQSRLPLNQTFRTWNPFDDDFDDDNTGLQYEHDDDTYDDGDDSTLDDHANDEDDGGQHDDVSTSAAADKDADADADSSPKRSLNTSPHREPQHHYQQQLQSHATFAAKGHWNPVTDSASLSHAMANGSTLGVEEIVWMPAVLTDARGSTGWLHLATDATAATHQRDRLRVAGRAPMRRKQTGSGLQCSATPTTSGGPPEDMLPFGEIYINMKPAITALDGAVHPVVDVEGQTSAWSSAGLRLPLLTDCEDGAAGSEGWLHLENATADEVFVTSMSFNGTSCSLHESDSVDSSVSPPPDTFQGCRQEDLEATAAVLTTAADAAADLPSVSTMATLSSTLMLGARTGWSVQASHRLRNSGSSTPADDIALSVLSGFAALPAARLHPHLYHQDDSQAEEDDLLDDDSDILVLKPQDDVCVPVATFGFSLPHGASVDVVVDSWVDGLHIGTSTGLSYSRKDVNQLDTLMYDMRLWAPAEAANVASSAFSPRYLAEVRDSLLGASGADDTDDMDDLDDNAPPEYDGVDDGGVMGIGLDVAAGELLFARVTVTDLPVGQHAANFTVCPSARGPKAQGLQGKNAKNAHWPHDCFTASHVWHVHAACAETLPVFAPRIDEPHHSTEALFKAVCLTSETTTMAATTSRPRHGSRQARLRPPPAPTGKRDLSRRAHGRALREQLHTGNCYFEYKLDDDAIWYPTEDVFRLTHLLEGAHHLQLRSWLLEVPDVSVTPVVEPDPMDVVWIVDRTPPTVKVLSAPPALVYADAITTEFLAQFECVDNSELAWHSFQTELGTTVHGLQQKPNPDLCRIELSVSQCGATADAVSTASSRGHASSSENDDGQTTSTTASTFLSADQAWSIPVSMLQTEGTQCLAVRGVDRAGNTGTEWTEVTWEVVKLAGLQARVEHPAVSGAMPSQFHVDVHTVDAWYRAAVDSISTNGYAAHMLIAKATLNGEAWGSRTPLACTGADHSVLYAPALEAAVSDLGASPLMLGDYDNDADDAYGAGDDDAAASVTFAFQSSAMVVGSAEPATTIFTVNSTAAAQGPVPNIVVRSNAHTHAESQLRTLGRVGENEAHFTLLSVPIVLGDCAMAARCEAGEVVSCAALTTDDGDRDDDVVIDALSVREIFRAFYVYNKSPDSSLALVPPRQSHWSTAYFVFEDANLHRSDLDASFDDGSDHDGAADDGSAHRSQLDVARLYPEIVYTVRGETEMSGTGAADSLVELSQLADGFHRLDASMTCSMTGLSDPSPAQYTWLSGASYDSAGVPSMPTRVSATPLDSSAMVRWYGSTDTGGTAIVSYTVVAFAFADNIEIVIPLEFDMDVLEEIVVRNGNSVARTYQVLFPSLANGQEYTFAVFARNLVGDSALSLTSAATTPQLTNNPCGAVECVHGSCMVARSGSAALQQSLLGGYCQCRPGYGGESCADSLEDYQPEQGDIFYDYVAGPWTTCTALCSGGTQRRRDACYAFRDGVRLADSSVPDKMCQSQVDWPATLLGTAAEDTSGGPNPGAVDPLRHRHRHRHRHRSLADEDADDDTRWNTAGNDGNQPKDDADDVRNNKDSGHDDMERDEAGKGNGQNADSKDIVYISKPTSNRECNDVSCKVETLHVSATLRTFFADIAFTVAAQERFHNSLAAEIAWALRMERQRLVQFSSRAAGDAGEHTHIEFVVNAPMRRGDVSVATVQRQLVVHASSALSLLRTHGTYARTIVPGTLITTLGPEYSGMEDGKAMRLRVLYLVLSVLPLLALLGTFFVYTVCGRQQRKKWADAMWGPWEEPSMGRAVSAYEDECVSGSSLPIGSADAEEDWDGDDALPNEASSSPVFFHRTTGAMRRKGGQKQGAGSVMWAVPPSAELAAAAAATTTATTLGMGHQLGSPAHRGRLQPEPAEAEAEHLAEVAEGGGSSRTSCGGRSGRMLVRQRELQLQQHGQGALLVGE